MYNYQIGYYSYEDSCYVGLSHEQKFTDAQMTEMISWAVVDKIQRSKDSPDKHYLHGFQDFLNRYGNDVIEFLVKTYGFTRITYEVVWDCFGWASVFDQSDWDGHDRDGHLKALTDAVNKAGFTVKDDSHARYMEESKEKYEEDHK